MGDSIVEVRTDGNSLLKAVYLCRLRLTRLLLEGGAYINESNERGETPLMIACKTKHADQQSVSKAKMIKYLLENGADPNIQDKLGKTALMHACLERAGVEVVSLLLASGADPSLEDHLGSSALVHAVNANEKDTLKVLLDACKARGKEVIIITTDMLHSGKQMTKQYLNVPPLPDLEDQLHYTPMSCMSPSEIELRTSQQATDSQLEKRIFNFQNSNSVTSQPGSPMHDPSPLQPGVAKLLHLQRLHSEPWLKIPSSLLLQQNRASSFTEDLMDITPEEELSFRINGLRIPRTPVTRQQSIDIRDTVGLSVALDQGVNNEDSPGGGRGQGRKMSYDDISSSHSSSHLDLHRNSGAAPIPVHKDPDCLPNLAVSSLRNIVQRRNIGIDHYSSDSQLPQSSSLDDYKSAPEKRKLASTRSSTLSNSRESLESLARRNPAMLERRGSGALLLDHISHTRPGYLPPLNPHVPIPDIGGSSSTATNSGMKPAGGTSANMGPKSLIPCVPNFPKDFKTKKMLLRRHSMQTEQIKQLVNFEEIFGR